MHITGTSGVCYVCVFIIMYGFVICVEAREQMLSYEKVGQPGPRELEQ